MLVAELQELEEVKGLITRGQQVGVLTYAEIATATVELGFDEPDVEELHGLFERCEIELVEEIDPATAASLGVERAQAITLSTYDSANQPVLRGPVESEQYTSADYTQVLDDHHVLASVGSVGDALDNAMAESFLDSFKTELIADRVWRTRSHLELAVVEYISWFNHDRLHESLLEPRVLRVDVLDEERDLALRPLRRIPGAHGDRSTRAARYAGRARTLHPRPRTPRRRQRGSAAVVQ
jgi:hypothetical protein